MTNVVSVLGVNKKYVVIPSQYKCQQGWIEIVVSIPAVYMSCMSYVTYDGTTNRFLATEKNVIELI